MGRSILFGQLRRFILSVISDLPEITTIRADLNVLDFHSVYNKVQVRP